MKLGIGLVIFVFCIKQSFSQTSFPSDASQCSYCHFRATCTEFDKYVTCACKPGYVGNGITCTALASSNNASCPKGYMWSPQSKKCEDINECQIGENICASTCYNRNGVYLCAYSASVPCPVNPCEAGKDCLRTNRGLQCVDPCISSQPLDANNRLYTINTTGVFQTDRYNYGWFHYTEGFRMRELNAGYMKCGSLTPFSFGVAHTTITQNITTVPLLVNSKNPTTGPNIQAKDCGSFYAYKFSGITQYAVYCTEPVPPATTTPTTTTTTTPTTTTTTTPTTPTSISTTHTSPSANNDTSTITPAASSTLHSTLILTPTTPTSTGTTLPISPTAPTSISTSHATQTSTSHQTSTPSTDAQTTSMGPDTTSVTDTTLTETTNSPTASTPTSFTQTHTVTPTNAPQTIKLTISIFGSSELINFLYIPLYTSSSNTPLHVVLEAQDSSNSRKHVILVNSWFAFGNDTSEDQTFFDNYKTKNCLLENNECYQEIPDTNPSPVRAFTNSNNGASDSSCLSKCRDGKQYICN